MITISQPTVLLALMLSTEKQTLVDAIYGKPEGAISPEARCPHSLRSVRALQEQDSLYDVFFLLSRRKKEHLSVKVASMLHWGDVWAESVYISLYTCTHARSAFAPRVEPAEINMATARRLAFAANRTCTLLEKPEGACY